MTHPSTAATSSSAATPEPVLPGERLVTQFSRDQRGLMAAALIAFLGVVFVGPAFTRAAVAARRTTRRTQARVRRLGGGAMFPSKRPR